jgi:hypothetical protein
MLLIRFVYCECRPLACQQRVELCNREALTVDGGLTAGRRWSQTLQRYDQLRGALQVGIGPDCGHLLAPCARADHAQIPGLQRPQWRRTSNPTSTSPFSSRRKKAFAVIHLKDRKRRPKANSTVARARACAQSNCR